MLQACWIIIYHFISNLFLRTYWLYIVLPRQCTTETDHVKFTLFSARKCKNINYLISYCRHTLMRIPVPTGEKFKVSARAFHRTTRHQRMTSNKLLLFVCRERLELSNYLSGNNQYVNAQFHQWFLMESFCKPLYMYINIMGMLGSMLWTVSLFNNMSTMFKLFCPSS